MAIRSGELIVAGALLWFTAEMWSRGLAALALLLALKSAVGLVAGAAVSPPFQPVPKLVALETFVYFALAGVLAIRFMTHRPRRTISKATLISFVYLTCAYIVSGGRTFRGVRAYLPHSGALDGRGA